MIPTLTTEMKIELISGLQNALGNKLQKIILYGSVVRGNATEDSDVDIAVIVGTALTKKETNNLISFGSYMDLKYDQIFSLMDIESASIEQWGQINPYYQNIEKEGHILWAKKKTDTEA